MTDCATNTQNLNSYYTSATKVEKPKKFVANAPDKIPSNYAYNKKEADAKWKALNADIYHEAEKEKKTSDNNTLKFVSGVAITILGIIGIKHLIKFFRKS